MAKNESAKKNRKRRSFYEPQSKVFNDWLDAQTDLGMSIQLLITDAIETYGDGDAIEAYFRTRIAGGIQPAAKLAPLAKNTLVEPVKETRDADVPKIVRETPSKQRAPKREPEPVPIANDAETAPVSADAPQIPEVTPQVEFDPLANIREDALRASAPKGEDTADYDPLKIMMEDVGSKINN